MFDRFFNADNPFWNSMGKIFDVFVLNMLWLLCCLPVFTIGPSTTAFYYGMISLVRGEEHYVSRDFFHSFTQNFGQGVCLGMPLTALGAFLALDIYLCYHSGTGIYTFFMVFFAIIFLFWSFVTLYSFPLLAKFEKKNKEILVWAFVLSIQHLGRTLLMLAAVAAVIWICRILPGLIFIAPGLAVEFHAALIASALKDYLPDLYAVSDEVLPSTEETDCGMPSGYSGEGWDPLNLENKDAEVIQNEKE